MAEFLIVGVKNQNMKGERWGKVTNIFDVDVD